MKKNIFEKLLKRFNEDLNVLVDLNDWLECDSKFGTVKQEQDLEFWNRLKDLLKLKEEIYEGYTEERQSLMPTYDDFQRLTYAINEPIEFTDILTLEELKDYEKDPESFDDMSFVNYYQEKLGKLTGMYQASDELTDEGRELHDLYENIYFAGDIWEKLNDKCDFHLLVHQMEQPEAKIPEIDRTKFKMIQI